MTLLDALLALFMNIVDVRVALIAPSTSILPEIDKASRIVRERLR